MNRRLFLFGSAAMVAGCARTAAPPASTAPPLTAADRARIVAEQEKRQSHLRFQEVWRVTEPRTTLPPPTDILAFAPELKPLVKVTLRLHPRFDEEPGPERTKFGGRIMWPSVEPWPVCDEHGIPFVPVLQLRVEDAPPQFAFRPGTDLLQLLWCPRDHGLTSVKPILVWRKQATVAAPFAEPPPTDAAFLNYVPVPCRVFPERVAELPPWDAPPKVLRDKLATWTAPPHPGRAMATPAEYYTDLLSTAAGTKVGGYPRFQTGAQVPTCTKCNWGMDYVLTVAAVEWTREDRARWKPREDTLESDLVGYRNAAGLNFGEHESVQVFVCRRCEDWPVKAG